MDTETAMMRKASGLGKRTLPRAQDQALEFIKCMKRHVRSVMYEAPLYWRFEFGVLYDKHFMYIRRFAIDLALGLGSCMISIYVL